MEEPVERLYANMKHYNDSFKRLRYEAAFEEYLYAARPCLQQLLEEMQVYHDSSKAAQEISKQLVDAVRARYCKENSKHPDWETQLTLNLFTTGYLLPAMLSMDSTLMNQLAEEIAICWGKAFKKSNITPATFQDINSGFKGRPCYITTAVCQSLRKGDDCHELQLLRDYRDGYLSSIPKGNELVDQYYDMAPHIVNAIEKHADKEVIYSSIYENHLLPCIRLIEERKPKEAMQAYKAMAEKLYKEYV